MNIVFQHLHQAASHLAHIQPFIPTYVHLIASALFPIYAGAHASLSRPSSAARAKNKKPRRRDGSLQQTQQRMEGLSPSDAILYPLLTGSMLAGLYFLIKWLNDAELLNKILNWYLSGFGVFGIARLLSDCVSTVQSFIFPSRFRANGTVWDVSSNDRIAIAKDECSSSTEPKNWPSPFPVRFPLPKAIVDFLWLTRDLSARPLCVLEIYLYDTFDVNIDLSLQGIFCSFIAISAVLYHNLFAKPWWLGNLLGFSFSYGAMQFISPTTLWTGTLVLTSLFFYDIYFVFFTPVMITVATKLDIPVKLLVPRPSTDDPATTSPGKKSMAMLGLGDIVLPGMIIGLALRFDLYLFYLRKQKQRAASKRDRTEISNSTNDTTYEPEILETESPLLVYDSSGLGKAEFLPATGGWGERFWLGLGNDLSQEGGAFPKPYFYGTVLGYIFGLLCTLVVMHVFKHGQPALLYLVPGVLISFWGLALMRGDFWTLWTYTEAADDPKNGKEDEKDAKGAQANDVKSNEDGTTIESEEQQSSKTSSDGKRDSSSPSSKSRKGQNDAGSDSLPSSGPDGESAKEKSKQDRRIIHFSLSFPDTGSSRPKQCKGAKSHPKLEKELKVLSKGPVGNTDAGSSSSSSQWSEVEGDDVQEPKGKRQRIA